MKLPNAERAFIDISKLRVYSLNPAHEEGQHKARVFASALSLTRSDADWLAHELLNAVRSKDVSQGEELHMASVISWISL